MIMRDAEWHGIADDYRSMLCCDLHKPIMAVLARWVHAVEIACTVPEGRFFEEVNLCHLPWDLAQRPAVEAAALRGDQP